jgi:lactobin A/cerein 7B family class IIb bacteriocin
MVNSSDPKALQEKFQEALSDEAFANKLFQMENPEDVQEALEEKGIELTLDEIRQIGELSEKIRNGEVSQEQVQSMADGELSEDELEEVAGGFGIFAIIGIIIAGGLAGGAITDGVLHGW